MPWRIGNPPGRLLEALMALLGARGMNKHMENEISNLKLVTWLRGYSWQSTKGLRRYGARNGLFSAAPSVLEDLCQIGLEC